MKYLFFILISACYICNAGIHDDNIQSLSANNEEYLLKNHNIIQSEWFNKQCLNIIQTLHLKRIQKCQLLDSNHNNAYVLPNGNAYITIELLKKLRNHHQLAVILAHENAHIELNHYQIMLDKIRNPGFFFSKRKFKKMMEKNEKEADQWAKETANKYNIDFSQIRFYLSRIDKNKSDERIKSIEENNKKSTEFMDDQFIFQVQLITNSLNSSLQQ